MENQFIERHIVIGLITSTDYLQKIEKSWNSEYLESSTAKHLAAWCWEYYNKYNKAPNQDIEGIFYQKCREGLNTDIAEEFEEEILPDLSVEYERKGFNLDYLLDQSKKYFSERHLQIHSETIKALVQQGDLIEAERLANSYTPVQTNSGNAINLSDQTSLERIAHAFDSASKPLFYYSGALGQFLNHQLIREGFIAFMASEKRGKSYLLLDIAKKAVQQRLKVAFFQAGDMSESQQIRRIGINLLKKSDREEYCGKMYEPVKDCIFNQLDQCEKKVRECDFGPFKSSSIEHLRYHITRDEIIDQVEGNDDYLPCHNCKEYQQKSWGAVWLKKVDAGNPIEKYEVMRAFEKYFIKKKRQLMLSTHANNSLSVHDIKSILDVWYKESFIPDVVIVDYADLLTTIRQKEERHKQNEIWKDLRSLSQERKCLVITATQADADSYDRNLLSLKNFSEDKRKYAHVTAMYGLNQDKYGREKEIGIMRINELLAREGDQSRAVTVLQNLRRGQPVLTSYW